MAKKFRPYKFVKDESFDPFYDQVNKTFVLKMRAYPALFISLGIIVLITQIIVPLVSFKTMDTVSKPVSSSVLGIASGFRDFEFNELGTGMGSTVFEKKGNIPEFFYLTVPKLGIEGALVETNAPDLNPDDALGHYKGSALPGEIGNVFIYGHSVMRIFYNPKNYKAIFSTLADLQAGDKFTINYNNKDYEYLVENEKVLKPKDVNPLAEIKPRYLNESTVILMTCVPSGTKINRLLMEARLITTASSLRTWGGFIN